MAFIARALTKLRVILREQQLTQPQNGKVRMPHQIVALRPGRAECETHAIITGRNSSAVLAADTDLEHVIMH